VAAVASTAFVLFISHHSSSATPRHALGGHFAALIVASGLSVAVGSEIRERLIGDMPVLFAFYAALGVGITMLAMAMTNTEHPPAAGTALGVVAHGFDWGLVFFVATAVVMLVAVHQLLRSRMADLS
jgi:uncharacterized oligopeptide transporter (OPT) family protein